MLRPATSDCPALFGWRSESSILANCIVRESVLQIRGGSAGTAEVLVEVGDSEWRERGGNRINLGEIEPCWPGGRAQS